MKRIWCLFCVSMFAFSSQTMAAKPGDVSKELTRQYRNTTNDCRGQNKPSFLCSGVLLRGTQPSTDYHAWEPSPSSIESGGVSFSYFRADNKSKRIAMGYKNGFLVYPNNLRPKYTKPLDIYCYFPIDADTFRRNNKGCGGHKFSYLKESAECNNQGIKTAKQWLNHYRKTLFFPRMHQCGFIFSDAPYTTSFYNNYASSTFNEAVKARNLETKSFYDPNEFRVKVWTNKDSKTLPIQAFFYVGDKLANAQYDQQDFHKVTGRVIPIVRIILPQKPNEQVRFIYNRQDQAMHIRR